MEPVLAGPTVRRVSLLVPLIYLVLSVLGLPSVSAGEPPPPREKRGAQDHGRREGPQRYSIEQAVSDQAQLHTIAFSGLAFITGDFGASTFIPPGKVCDFFGFYLIVSFASSVLV